MVKILTYGDNPHMSTGYGQVWNNLLSRWVKLKPDWEFMHVGWQGKERKHITAEGYYILPSGRLEKGVDTIVPYLLEHKPDFLITLADVGKQSGFTKLVHEAKQQGWRGKWIMYTPVDCHQWAFYWDEIFSGADINVAMSEFGYSMMKENNVKNLYVIPHGVDTKTYFPREDREGLKIRYNINGKFVVGFVGRNQTRKMVAYLMRGFAKFAKGKDDVCLLLHTDRNPPGGDMTGWNIDSVIFRLEQETGQELFKNKKIMVTRDNMDILTRQVIPETSMNDIYNLFDIFLYATGGEGFGLPGIESQASGIPILMSNNTTGPELVGKTGELINMLKDQYGRIVGLVGLNGVENLMPNDEHIKELLEKYYADWKGDKSALKEMSKKGREFSLNYDWDLIAPKWIALFENER